MNLLAIVPSAFPQGDSAAPDRRAISTLWPACWGTIFTVAAGLCAVLLGASLTLAPALTLPLIAAVGLLAAQVVGRRGLLICLIAATFVTQYRAAVFGVHFLPEDLAALALLVGLVSAGRGARLWRAVADPTVLLFAVFIGWQAVVSAIQAPDPAASLAITGWLGLDLLILIACIAAVDEPAEVERYGVMLAALAGLAALGFWTASLLHLSSLGTQTRPRRGCAQGIRPLMGAEHPRKHPRTVGICRHIQRRCPDSQACQGLCPNPSCLRLVSAFTRAALLGLGAGVVIWGALAGRIARRRVARLGLVGLGVAAVLAVAVSPVVQPVGKVLGSSLDLKTGTGAYRVTVVEQAFTDMHGADLIVGLGANSFGQRHVDFTRPDTPGYLSVLPLQVLYDSGLVGVGLLVLLIASLEPFRRPNSGRALGLLTVYTMAARLRARLARIDMDPCRTSRPYTTAGSPPSPTPALASSTRRPERGECPVKGLYGGLRRPYARESGLAP